MTETRRTWFACSAILLSALSVIPIGLTHLGFVRDDWNHYAVLRELRSRSSFWESLRLIASNEWFGAHELRIFFGSFITHYAISLTGSAAPFLAYFTQLTMYTLAAVIFGWLVWHFTRSFVLGATLALSLVYFPAILQPAIWINNLFFVQNWFFLSLSALLMTLTFKPVLRTTLLTLCVLSCAFSGESTLTAVVVMTITYSTIMYRKSSSTGNKVLAIAPSLFLILALSTYLALIVRWPAGSGSEINLAGLREFDSYLFSASLQAMSLVVPFSISYGSGSVLPSPTSFLFFLPVVLLACVGMFLAPKDRLGTVRSWKLLLVPVVGLVCALVPMALGVVTGSRPDPDLRYLGFPTICIVSVGVMLIHHRMSLIAQHGERLFRRFSLLLIVCTVPVSLFNIIDIWGFQRKVDAQIWEKVDKLLTHETFAIVTFNPNHMYLMAPYHSNAVSDFQADWGVAGRILWKHPTWERKQIFRDAAFDQDALAFRDYYGDTFTCVERKELSGNSAVIYMTYDYGPRFSDLISSPLLVTTSLEQFLKSRNAILQSHGVREAWLPKTECKTS